MRYTAIIFLVIFTAASCKLKKQTVAEEFSKEQTDTLRQVTASMFIIEGMSYKLRGEYEKAVQSFIQCIRYDPVNDAAYFNLSQIYSNGGMHADALASAEKAVKLRPENEWYLIHLAGLYQEYNRPKDAITTYEKLIRSNKTNIRYYFLLSDAYLQSEQPEKAVQALSDAEKAVGPQSELIFQKFRIYSFLKEYTKAIGELEKMLEADSTDVRVYGMIAETYEEQGLMEKALEYYKKILEIDPGNGIAHISLSRYYYSINQEEKAFEELKLAFYSPDLDVDTKMRIMLSYYETGLEDLQNRSESFELLDIMLSVHPSDAKSYSIYGDFLMLDQKKEEALEMFKKAVMLEKSNYVLWQQVVVLEFELEKIDSAYAHSKEAMELFPTQAGMYYFHGTASYHKKLYQEAVDALLAGKDLIIDEPALLFEFYQMLGDAYHKLNDHEQSDYYFEEALKIKPDHALLLNNYSYYLAVRNENLDKAVQMAKKANELAPDQVSYQDTYGYILFRKKDYDAAEKWLKKAMDNGGDKVGVIVEHYGDVLFMLGKTDEAVTYWQKAKDLGDVSELIDKKINERKFYE